MSSDSFFPRGKRRGRPPRKYNAELVGELQHAELAPNASVIAPSPPTPNFPIFRCRWKGCKAHLHNLATLRQHVSKVHRPSKDEIKVLGFVCWWKKCQYLQEDKEGAIRPEKTFSSVEGWLHHIEKDHLYQIALKYGDGPSTTHIGKQRVSSFDVSRCRYHPAPRQKARTFSYLDPQTILRDRARYLSDENERVTTPVIPLHFSEDFEPDTMTLLKADHDDAEAQAQHSFMKTHRQEKSTPKAVAEETLRAMVAWKAKVGPGIDRGGCILVNEARRATLLQNPGIARVVDANY
ncbi:uncharacterized protein Z518_05224 [Rhinocladiella mackenziei CBS 650.93]|uniref:Rhinocladiella mackenziei CBS 650.93 unplaced genomic scaffold supercont1.4, whole genome shotgun sequence n=1 Tax=Rhinocladiella mackenziei CBS 650.93 TaxID=1442369 RepID=A0A0D2IMI0_9EURO|nr:uncharacterized protein Z518_05224 [Rhinocladiella mackenziei CBS 650.93]KIX04356.1 hypothetical protein Z518_05224 [Rhinocladiella mackenziei CBS 650.93]